MGKEERMVVIGNMAEELAEVKKMYTSANEGGITVYDNTYGTGGVLTLICCYPS